MPIPFALPATTGEAPAEAVAPLIRGIAVLCAITEANGALSLPDLEHATGLARATLDRVTGTLTRMGQLRLDGRTVVLTPRLMALGNAYLAGLRLPELLGPHADDLARELNESVSLSVADGDGIRFIHQSLRRRTLSVSFRIGDLLPAEHTAPGPLVAGGWGDADWERWRARRALDPAARTFPAMPTHHPGRCLTEAEFAASAELASRRGWALDDQLIEPGLVALAMPVRDPRGGLACVASLVSHTSRHSAQDLRRTLLPRLGETVTAMEQRLRQALIAPPAPALSGLASWTTAAKQELGRGFVESLARGLTVITAFGEGRRELTLTAVAEATGLARATARRALITLEHLGLVATEARTFRLTPRVLALGYAPLSRLTLPQIAQPHLATLTERVRDCASLAVLDGGDVRYTARVVTKQIMSVEITIGTRFPAYATSMGRILLADLPAADRAALLDRMAPRPLTSHTITDRAVLNALSHQVADQGFALVDQELEEGLRSIAVPVRDRTGRAVAAVNVAMHTGRRTIHECLARVLPELRATAQAIEADLAAADRFGHVLGE